MKLKSLINYKLDCNKANSWIDFEISKRANPDNYSNQVVSDYSMSNDDNYKKSGMILHDNWNIEQETNTYSKMQFSVTYLEETGFYLSTHDQIRVVYHHDNDKETLFLGSIADVQEDTDNPNTPQKTFTYDCYGVEKNVFEMPIVKTWRDKTIREILNDVFKIWVQDNINGFKAIDFKNSPQWDRKISKLSHEDSIERLLQVLVIDNGGLWWVQDNELHLSTKEYVEHSLFTAPKEEDIGDLRSPLVINQNDDKYANQVKFKCKDVKGKQIADNDLGTLDKNCDYVLPYQVYSPSAENLKFIRGKDEYKFVETIDEGTDKAPSTEKQFSVNTQAGKTVISFWPKDEECKNKAKQADTDTSKNDKKTSGELAPWDDYDQPGFKIPSFADLSLEKDTNKDDVRTLSWSAQILNTHGGTLGGNYVDALVTNLDLKLFIYHRNVNNFADPMSIQEWEKAAQAWIAKKPDTVPWDVSWSSVNGTDWLDDSIFTFVDKDTTTINIDGVDYRVLGDFLKIPKEENKIFRQPIVVNHRTSVKAVDMIVEWMNTKSWWQMREDRKPVLHKLQNLVLDFEPGNVTSGTQSMLQSLIYTYDGIETSNLVNTYRAMLQSDIIGLFTRAGQQNIDLGQFEKDLRMTGLQATSVLGVNDAKGLTNEQKVQLMQAIMDAKTASDITAAMSKANKWIVENTEKEEKAKEVELNATLSYYQNINEVIVLDNIDEQSKLHAVLDAGWIVSKDITNTRITTLDDAINYCKQYLKESVKVEEEVTLELFRGDLPTPLTNWKFEPHAVSLQNLEHITGFVCGYHGSNQKQGIAKGTYLRKYNSKLYLQHYRKITQSRVATPKLFEVKTSGKLDHKNIMIADKIPVSALHFQYELNEGFKSMWEDYFNRDKYKYVDDDTEESNLSETTNLSQNSMSKGFDMVANNVTIDDAKYSITDSEIEKDKLSDDFNKKAVN